MPLHAVMDNPDSARTAWNRLPSLTSIDASLLPDSARQIAEVIGLPQTLALVSRLGGCTLPVPNGVSKRGRAILRLVGDIIGEDNARKLRDAYRATTLYIPNCKGALVQARNMALTRDRDMLAGQGMCERDIVFRLAIRYGISDRYIWQILKNPVTIPEGRDWRGTQKQAALI